MGLWSDFLSNQGPPVHKWAHYFPIYERHLTRFVNRPCTMLEIGFGSGGSCRMWERFLGPLARIVTVDIREECLRVDVGERIAVRIGDQSDPAFLARLHEEFGPFDVVLDDGSHVMAHVMASFGFLYPRMSPDGVYLVEDLHTAYHDTYGGGLRREGTFIEHAKGLIDELHAGWTGGALKPTEFTRTTLSLHVYDSVVVLERGRVRPPVQVVHPRW